jgi:hypothetical protein
MVGWNDVMDIPALKGDSELNHYKHFSHPGTFDANPLYIGECSMRNNCDRTICLNASKVRPVDVGRVLYINLTLNGVSVAARAVDGFSSAAHSEEDINNTIEAFAVSLDRAIAEGALKNYIRR